MQQVLIVIAALMVVSFTEQDDNNALHGQILSDSPSLALLDEGPTHFLSEISAHKDDLIRFGIQILVDDNGNKVGAIEESVHEPYVMAREICRQWLAGKGKQPVSWKTLISVLEQIQLNTLADKIRNLVSAQVVTNLKPHQVEDAVKLLRERYSKENVIQFDLLNIAHHTSFLEITMKMDNGLQIHMLQWLNILQAPHTIQMPKSLLITGHPGTGKTTLLRYLAKEWAEGRVFHFCQVLFLIHLGQLRSRGQSAWKSITDMLTSAYSDIKDIQNIALEIAAINGAGACFLLDAYDEWYDDDYVHDLVFQQSLSSSFCILTSRYIKENNYGVDHIEMIGYEDKNLEHFVAVIANNSSLTQSVLDLWSKYPDIRFLCTVPLHLAMVVFIMRYENTPRIHTRTLMYVAFMNATIKYYQYPHHPYWNTVSLKHCILNDTDAYASDLCTAFKYLHFVAFKMLFNKVYTFPDQPAIRQNIAKLGFVDIKLEHSISDPVQYTFSHPTFLEFFAVLHLLTLSRNEQLVYINLFGREHNNNMVSLFTELINFYPNEQLHVEGAGIDSYSVNRKIFHPICSFTHINSANMRYNIVTQMCSARGTSDQIESDNFLRFEVNAVCIHDIWNYRLLLENVLNLTAVHRVHLSGGNTCMNYSVVLEDWNKSTNVSYLDSIHACLSSGQLHDCMQFTALAQVSVKILSIEGLTLSQTCIHLLFGTIRNYLPSSFLFQMHASHILVENMFMLNDEINSLHGIDVEVIVKVDDCEWTDNIIEQLKLFKKLKGVHIISDCTFVVEEIVIFDRTLMALSILHLPQYTEILNITGNIPFLMNLFYGQRHLRHLYLHKISMKLIYTDWFFQYIERNQYLQTLEITDCRLTDTNIKELLKHLPGTLRALNLDGNCLTDNTVGELALSLRNFSKFSYLSLKRNKIMGNFNSIKLLVSAMASNGHFRYLDLSNNPISEQYSMEILQLENLEYLAFDGHRLLNNDYFLAKLRQSFIKLQCLHLCKNLHRPVIINKENLTDGTEYPDYNIIEKPDLFLALDSSVSMSYYNTTVSSFLCSVADDDVHVNVCSFTYCVTIIIMLLANKTL